MPEDQVADRSHVVVVTPDNHAAFVDSKLGAVANTEPEKKEEPKAEAKPEVKAEEPKEQEKEAVQLDKKEGKLNKRFSELTEQRRVAEARAEAAEKKAADLEAKLNPQPKKDEDAEPRKEDFTDPFDYAKALADHSVKKALKESEKKAVEKEATEARDKTIKSFRERQEVFAKETKDYTEKVEAAEVVVSNQVREMILESDVGPQILYHFAENPKEAERIGQMSVDGAARAIGRLEARLEGAKSASKSEPEKKEPAPKVEISKAPEPITPLKGANSPVALPINSKGEWTGSYQDFKKAVEEGKIK